MAAWTASWLRIALGAALIVLGVWQWLTRHRSAHSPAWLRAISSITPARAGGAGAALAVINPKVLFVCLPSGLEIGTKAHRKNGDRCKHAALANQRVCAYHGGKARHSMEAARRRLMENADPAVKQLTEIACEETKSDEIRLKATLALIDGAGLTPKTSLDIEVTAQPFETVFEVMEIEGGSRSEYRRSQGIEDPPALVPASEPEADVIEVEVDYLIPNETQADFDYDAAPPLPRRKMKTTHRASQSRIDRCRLRSHPATHRHQTV